MSWMSKVLRIIARHLVYSYISLQMEVHKLVFMLDLTLARTYTPACMLILKSCGWVSVVVLLRLLHMGLFHAYVIAFCMLYVIGRVHKECVIDTNGICGTCLFALAFNDIRNTLESDDKKYMIVVILDCIWVGMNVSFTMHLHRYFSVFNYIHIYPYIITCIMICVHSFIHLSTEETMFHLSRVANFIILVLLWVYVIQANYLNGKSIVSIYDVIDCFGSVLFVEHWISVVAMIILTALIFFLQSDHANWFHMLLHELDDMGRDKRDSLDCDDDYESQHNEIESNMSNFEFTADINNNDVGMDNDKSGNFIDDETQRMFLQAKSKSARYFSSDTTVNNVL